MKELGLVSNYEEYLDLPLAVLDDVRILAEGAAIKQEREARRSR